MSVINGIWHKNGRPLDKEHLFEQAAFNERYAPDGTIVRHAGVYGMSFQGFHTHERSSFEPGPREDSLGNMAVLDGRIDNGEQICQELGLPYRETSDTALVLAGFRKWGKGCFSRMVGDWAIAVWSDADRSLYLGRDHAGTRTLYYADSQDSLVWSTYPEPLIPRQSTFTLCDGYAVRYLACLPLDDLTPYDHIRTVRPGHYLHFSKTEPVKSTRHWRPALREDDEHRPEASHQEEFLHLFRQAVKRRVAGSNQLVCHLSGGMDSTAIVCVADLLTQEGVISEQVRTLSFGDPSEPNWDDHLYFTVVESRRGKVGIHIYGALMSRSFESAPAHYPLPGADSESVHRELEFENRLGPGTVRTIVAGHGGDELLGGRPDPIPELADYLYRFQWKTFVSRGFEWAQGLRKPLISIAHDAGRFVWNQYPRPRSIPKHLPPWMEEQATGIARTTELRLWQKFSMGHRPSELDKQDTWENLSDTLPHLFHANTVRYEYRYPFLDKDLAEFLLCVPLRQLRLPSRRRWMMRRAMQGIVPPEILERRRKAFVGRSPLLAVQNNMNRIVELISLGMLVEAGLLNLESYLHVLNTIKRGEGSLQPLSSINRAIELELWMNQTATACHIPGSQSGDRDLHTLC